MPDTRAIRSLGVEAPGRMGFFGYEEGPPEEGQVRIETLYSGFSAGTELTFVKGSNPYLHARWDESCGVFVHQEPGVTYPIPFLGYMEVGRVLQSRSSALHEGQVVAATYGHKTGHTATPGHDFVMPLPDGLDPLLGIHVAQMGPICANGLLHAAADLVGIDVRDLGEGVRGRNVLVLGAGVVGLLTALFARRFGAAEVVVADPSAFRRAKTKAMGFLALDEAGVGRALKQRWSHGRSDCGADLVFQARANADSLSEALRALRAQGTVIDLAFYQGGAPALRLGEEFHHNGLAIRCAQIGRVPRGLAFAWTRGRLARETIALLEADGDQIRAHMITDIVAFDEAPGFIADLVERRRDFLQIVFRMAP